MKNCMKAIIAVLAALGAAVAVKTVLELADNSRKIYSEVNSHR